MSLTANGQRLLTRAATNGDTVGIIMVLRIQCLAYSCAEVYTIRWLVVGCPGGCFTNVSRALQNNLAKIYNARNNIYAENFKLKPLYVCPISHKKYDINNIQISREYFGELAKR